MTELSVWLIHPNESMCAAFRQRFADLPRVRVIRSRFEDFDPHDCFVTTANAFGMMTAGIDAAVVRVFGEELMQRMQHRIMTEPQPVNSGFMNHSIQPRMLSLDSCKITSGSSPWRL